MEMGLVASYSAAKEWWASTGTAERINKAIRAAPAEAVDSGPFNAEMWKYGPAFNPPAAAKIWNPVKRKMMQGGKVTGGTLFAATDSSTYGAMPNAGYDFIWTEM